MIFNQTYIKKYGVIMDIINNSIALWLNYCVNIRSISAIISSQFSLPMQTATVIIKKDITSQKMIKRHSKNL